MSKKRLFLLSFRVLIVLVSSFFVFAATMTEDFIVVAHSSVQVSSLGLDEFHQMIFANKKTWPDGSKVVIILLSSSVPGADSLIEKAMKMTALQARKFYLSKVFNGILSASPTLGDSVEEVVELVSKTKGAMAVVPVGTVTGTAKVLQIEK